MKAAPRTSARTKNRGRSLLERIRRSAKGDRYKRGEEQRYLRAERGGEGALGFDEPQAIVQLCCKGSEISGIARVNVLLGGYGVYG